jgi:hypothetical protein
MRNSEKSLVNMLLSAVTRNRKRGKLTSPKSVFSLQFSKNFGNYFNGQIVSQAATVCMYYQRVPTPPSPFPQSP